MDKNKQVIRDYLWSKFLYLLHSGASDESINRACQEMESDQLYAARDMYRVLADRREQDRLSRKWLSVWHVVLLVLATIYLTASATIGILITNGLLRVEQLMGR